MTFTLFAGVLAAICAVYFAKLAWRLRSEVEPQLTTPQPPPQPPQETKTRRDRLRGAWSPLARVAAHEAGHAVVALRCSHVIAIDSVVVDAQKKSGRCSYREFSNAGDAVELVITLGGIAGEAEAFGSFHGRGTEADLHQALFHASELFVNGRSFSFTPRKRRGISFGKVFKKDHDPEVLSIIERAYDVARDIVEDHAVGHSRLTGHLIHRHEAKEADIEAIFGERKVFARLAALGKPRFV